MSVADPVRRVLMTTDAVGGVWRYALTAARGLAAHGIATRLLGIGPPPQPDLAAEVTTIPGVTLVWSDAPLDWMAADAAALAAVPRTITQAADDWRADLLHLNLPSQAVGIATDWPVVVVAHSCLPTWWEAVRGGDLPSHWDWHARQARCGFDRADAVLVPSLAHGAALQRVHGPIAGIEVVPNASDDFSGSAEKDPCVFAAGRWWDDGKNGQVLDAAAATLAWSVVMAGPCQGADGSRFTARHAATPGALSPTQTRAAMGRAAVFAAPSRYEPFGLAVLEAACAGAALVLSDIPTFRELWNGAAVFVAPDDAGAWAAALEGLAGDAPRRRALAARGQARAAAFTVPRQARALTTVFATARHRARLRPAGAAAAA